MTQPPQFMIYVSFLLILLHESRLPIISLSFWVLFPGCISTVGNIPDK